jgi:NTE family protein
VALIRPDVLVLAAGGVVGEAWMTGVLRGLTESTGIDFRGCDYFVGTSAGSIVAASLAAGREPRGPTGRAPHQEAADGGGSRSPLAGAVARGMGTLAAPLARPALAASAPGGALARRAIFSRVPEGRRPLTQLRNEVERWGARFDGRLRICALDVASGRRVVFGEPGAPTAEVGQAVEASCAVPGVFRPVVIGGRTYVDGGAWSITNLDAAPADRDTHVLCLTVTGGRVDASAAGLLRAATRPAVAVETAALRRRGAHVKVIAPDTGLGSNLLDPRGADAALHAGHAQGLRVGNP